MGSSAREIEQQIRETRERMDENLNVLESPAASGAVRYGRIAAIAVGVAVVAGAGFLIFRRVSRPTLKGRLERMSPSSLRNLTDALASRLRRPLPTVQVTVSEKGPKLRTFQSIAREVAPTLVGTAATAIVERAARQAGDSRGRRTAPRAD
jgi:hypothetical protein